MTSGASHGFQQGHEYLATAAAFFRSGKKFLTAAADDTTRIWDVETGMNILTLRETGSSAAAVLSDDETQILTGGKDPAGDNYAAKLWDAQYGQTVALLPRSPGGDHGRGDFPRPSLRLRRRRPGVLLSLGGQRHAPLGKQLEKQVRSHPRRESGRLPARRPTRSDRQQRPHGRAMGRGHGKIVPTP